MGQLADAIKAEARVIGGTCTVPGFVAELPKEIRADFNSAIKAGVQTAQLVRGLRKLGHHIGESTLRRHRRGECSCGRAS